MSYPSLGFEPSRNPLLRGEQPAEPTRTEHDALGDVEVPKSRYYGAQTERALCNFSIGQTKMPRSVLIALAHIKKSVALENAALQVLDEQVGEAIAQAADEMIAGKFDGHFPLSVYQTGSGTQSHMNVNEVLARRASELLPASSRQTVHPNDHVNRGQSTNDVFGAAMHVAVIQEARFRLWPALREMSDAFLEAKQKYGQLVKVGRTHYQDALPLTFGLELDTFREQLAIWWRWLERSVDELHGLPLGGTAVGTGVGAHPQLRGQAIARLGQALDLELFPLPTPTVAMASHAALVAFHGHLKGLATTLSKIESDIRFLSSGPRTGIGELNLVANEPGSSMMPGKVNPTQAEALSMVVLRVLGNDSTVSQAECRGHLQLNVTKPLLIYAILESLELLSDAMVSFTRRCLVPMCPDPGVNENNVNASLSLAVALRDRLGHELAATIARRAHETGTTLKDAAVDLGALGAEEFDDLVQPARLARAVVLDP